MVPFLPQNGRLCRVLKTPCQKPIRLTRSPTWAPRKRPHRAIRKAKVCARAKTNPVHKTGQCSKCAPEKGQAGPQERLQIRVREKRLFRDPQGHCQDSKPNQDR
ncbi:hypothetical protein F4703DRAFT_1799297 [Phycomyces blakesleeanus]